MAWAWMELAIEVARNDGDPVTYQHFYSVSVSPASWALGAYVLIPNAVLGALYAKSMLLRHNATAGK